jgi:hypothetical protein
MDEQDFKKDLSALDNDRLISLRVLVESEMALRNISIDVGDVGERLAIEFFNSTPGLSNLMKAPKGAKNVDALSRNGERYSIKAIMKAKKTGTIYPDSHDPNKQLFEHLLLVCLNSRYQLESIYSFTWETFLMARAWDKRMNAWYVPVSGKRLKLAEKLFPKENRI